MSKANNPSLRSWIEVPAQSDFPIQNLPFGIFRYQQHVYAGVAIGDQVLNLHEVHQQNLFNDLNLPQHIFAKGSLNDFFRMGRKNITKVRNRVSDLLSESSQELRSLASTHRNLIIPSSDVKMLMPVKVPNYTDFYSSEEHATNVGSMFRDPKNALLPNWKHLPVAYHGRASSIVVSGTNIIRPKGQTKAPDAASPIFESTRKLDFELEVAFVSCAETSLGEPIPATLAEDHIAGFVLFNDWSARDIQQWEYVPLGPFLGKNFASTVSPWVVTLDALEPFKTAGPKQDPVPLPYLQIEGERHYDIVLEVSLSAAGGPTVVISRTNFKYMYWSIHQQLAHHTVNGCNIMVGDLFASGTISGPSPGSYGSLLELTWNGERPLQLPGEQQRKFLEDGDTVIIKGYAERDGVRIGFGECRGTIEKAT
jgi:fumarylacetoacetase